MVRKTVYEKIEEHEEELKKLYAERDVLERMNAEQRLAVYVHEKTCHSDHIESCGWYYEIEDGVHNWDGYAHKRAFEVAWRLLKEMDVDAAKRLIDAGLVKF